MKKVFRTSGLGTGTVKASWLCTNHTRVYTYFIDINKVCIYPHCCVLYNVWKVYYDTKKIPVLPKLLWIHSVMQFSGRIVVFMSVYKFGHVKIFNKFNIKYLSRTQLFYRDGKTSFLHVILYVYYLKVVRSIKHGPELQYRLYQNNLCNQLHFLMQYLICSLIPV